MSFAGDPNGYLDPQGTGVEFVGEPATQDTLIAGQPQLDLEASVTAPRVHLIANVYDQALDGDRRRISQFAINPELRKGIETHEPVTPDERYLLQPPGYASAHNLRAGHQLILRVTTSDPDKVPLFAVDPNVTVFTGPSATELRLPVIDDPTLYPDDLTLTLDDVPPGPAQPTISSRVTPTAPGAGVRADPVTSTMFEFDVWEDFSSTRTASQAPRAALLRGPLSRPAGARLLKGPPVQSSTASAR